MLAQSANWDIASYEIPWFRYGNDFDPSRLLQKDQEQSRILIGMDKDDFFQKNLQIDGNHVSRIHSPPYKGWAVRHRARIRDLWQNSIK